MRQFLIAVATLTLTACGSLASDAGSATDNSSTVAEQRTARPAADTTIYDRLGQLGLRTAQHDGMITDAVGTRIVHTGEPIYSELTDDQRAYADIQVPAEQAETLYRDSGLVINQSGLKCRTCASTGCGVVVTWSTGSITASATTHGQCVSAYGRRVKGWYKSSRYGCWFWSGGTDRPFGPC
jgi:hypothetical protein